jgi:hypothetical protein
MLRSFRLLEIVAESLASNNDRNGPVAANALDFTFLQHTRLVA